MLSALVESITGNTALLRRISETLAEVEEAA
ncbi:hypothetical protein [Yersinia phage vB_YenS-P840]|nr:hypothetical protein [Yersinia phage vB_YenS-P840]